MTQRIATQETRLLTIAELARSLELPESTTRYYCNRFADHLPSVGEGRRRRYKPEALETLRTIAATMRRDKNAYAVDLVLQNETEPRPSLAAQSLPQAQAAFAEQILSQMECQTNALQSIAQAMTAFAEKLSVSPAGHNEAAAGTAGTGEAEIDALRDEITSLKEHIRASESVHQNDLDQLRKWLTRLGEAVAHK